jgi:c-di-GMP-binding flagellar brake protein YcgR
VQSVVLRHGQTLKLWDQLEILVGDGERRGKYRARIEDFMNGGIVINTPEFVDGDTLLRNGVDVLVSVCREDASYQFWSKIKQATGASRELYFLSPPRDIRRVQRRQFVRIEVDEKLQYSRIIPTLEFQYYEDRAVWHDSRTRDISGGGALIELVEPIRVGELLLLRMALFPDLALPELVVALCRRIVGRGRKALAGVEFITDKRLFKYFKVDELRRLPETVREFDTHAQDRLVNYVFRKQIQMRNKGLL